MAHKLDNSKGKTAFVSFQQAAWHGLGTVVTSALSAKQALEMGGLDFEVLKSPNVHRIGAVDLVSETSFFTYRTDTNAILGSRLGPDYTVWQNSQALDIVDDLIGTNRLTIETAGAVDGGRRVFICMKLNDPIKVVGKDEVFQYLLIANGHDGTLAIAPIATNVRVVCSNTLGAALGGARALPRIRHTANAHDRVKQALTIMGLMDTNKRANAAAYEAMAATKISNTDFFNYIGNIFIDGEDIKELQKGNQGAISTRTKNIIEEVLEFAETGVGQREALNGGGLNMWFAYNAVTGYLTGKKYGSLDQRFNSMILGDTAMKIENASALALSVDSIKPLHKIATAGLGNN